ncbi:MAG: hypothetical protein WD004_02725 [Actinomycetota bacterium]
MPTREEFDELSSEELAERAMSLAKHRVDVGFFWSLLKAIPAAEAAAGNVDEATMDVHSLMERVRDLLHADEGDLADALRPIYIEYLDEHQGGEASWKA